MEKDNLIAQSDFQIKEEENLQPEISKTGKYPFTLIKGGKKEKEKRKSRSEIVNINKLPPAA